MQLGEVVPIVYYNFTKFLLKPDEKQKSFILSNFFGSEFQIVSRGLLYIPIFIIYRDRFYITCCRKTKIDSGKNNE